MSKAKGRKNAPSYEEVVECLSVVAQSLEWHAHGSCRGFHAGGPVKTGHAIKMAKIVLDRIESAPRW